MHVTKHVYIPQNGKVKVGDVLFCSGCEEEEKKKKFGGHSESHGAVPNRFSKCSSII